MLRARGALLLLLAALACALRYTAEWSTPRISGGRDAAGQTWIFQFAPPEEPDAEDLLSPLTPVHYIWPDFTPGAREPSSPDIHPSPRNAGDDQTEPVPSADGADAADDKDLTWLPPKSLETSRIRGCFPVIACGPVENSITPQRHGGIVPPQVTRSERELPRPRIYGPASRRSEQDYATYVATVREGLAREADRNAYESVYLVEISRVVVNVGRRLTGERIGTTSRIAAERGSEMCTVAANWYQSRRKEALARIAREKALATSRAWLSYVRARGGLAPSCQLQLDIQDQAPSEVLSAGDGRVLARAEAAHSEQSIQNLSAEFVPDVPPSPWVQKTLTAFVTRFTNGLSRLLGEFRTALWNDQATSRR